MMISIIGGMIIAVGLYSVVWGKSKDYSASSSTTKAADDTKQLPNSSKSDDAT